MRLFGTESSPKYGSSEGVDIRVGGPVLVEGANTGDWQFKMAVRTDMDTGSSSGS